MLKLKLQYFGHLMQGADSLEKTLMRGKTEGGKRKGETEDEMRDSIQSMDVSSSKLLEMVRTGKPQLLQPVGLQRVGRELENEQQQEL